MRNKVVKKLKKIAIKTHTGDFLRIKRYYKYLKKMWNETPRNERK